MPETSATWEDARRCPKCREAGEVVGKKPSRDGNTIITLMCQNDRCRWHKTTYIVQQRPDGSIPAPNTRPSGMRPLPDDGGRTEEILQRQLEAMRRGGAEMPGRG